MRPSSYGTGDEADPVQRDLSAVRRRRRDRREVIAGILALPEMDLKEPLPSEIQMKVENRVVWAMSYFLQAIVLESPLTCFLSLYQPK